MTNMLEKHYPELAGTGYEPGRARRARRGKLYEKINHHKPKGREQLRELVSGGAEVNLLPYLASAQEAAELHSAFENVPQDKEELVKQHTNGLHNLVNGQVSMSRIRRMLKKSNLPEDTLELAKRVREHLNPQALEEGSNWYRNRETGVIFKLPGESARETFRISRFLDLVPFAALDALAKMKVVVIGTSASSPAVEALAACGVKNFVLVDPGLIADSNQPRYLGDMASVVSLGQLKSENLASTIWQRNPDARIKVIKKKAVPPDKLKDLKNEVGFDRIVDGAQLVMEGIDSLPVKAQFDEWMRIYHPHTLIGFFADLGLFNAVVHLGKADESNHFGAPISAEDVERIAEPVPGVSGIQLLFAMLKDRVPLAHGLQLALFGAGQHPFWSQSATASRETAAMFPTLVLAHLSGLKVLGRRMGPEDVAKIEFFRGGRAAQATMREITRLLSSTLPIPAKE